MAGALRDFLAIQHLYRYHNARRYHKPFLNRTLAKGMFEDDFPNNLLPHSRLLCLLFLTPGRPTPVVLESIATQVASNKLGRRNHHPLLAVEEITTLYWQ